MSLKAYTYTLFIVPQRTSVGESLSRGVLSYYLLGYRKLILSRVLFLPYFPIVLLGDEPSDAGDIVEKSEIYHSSPGPSGQDGAFKF